MVRLRPGDLRKFGVLARRTLHYHGFSKGDAYKLEVWEYPNGDRPKLAEIFSKASSPQREQAELDECLPYIKKAFPSNRFTIELVEDEGLSGTHSKRGRGLRKCIRISKKA